MGSLAATAALGSLADLAYLGLTWTSPLSVGRVTGRYDRSRM